MVRVANFGEGKSALFGLTLVWRGELARYGKLCSEMGALRRGSTEWQELHEEVAMLAHKLADRGARAELDAQRYRCPLAEEA